MRLACGAWRERRNHKIPMAKAATSSARPINKVFWLPEFVAGGVTTATCTGAGWGVESAGETIRMFAFVFGMEVVTSTFGAG